MVTEELTTTPPVMDSLLPRLLSPVPEEVQECVTLLMSEIESQCEELVEALVKDPRCDQYLAALCKFLHTDNIRLCSNVAYILGTVAEDAGVAVMLVNLAESATDWDLLGRLGALLLWDDAECVMNAAGALGTLAENGHGRRWLLCSPESDFIIENITRLLDSPNDWTASNCALVLARISMCQEGCARLLEHPRSDLILQKIISSLRVDEAELRRRGLRGRSRLHTDIRMCDGISAVRMITGGSCGTQAGNQYHGCGLNAAFTLGRLCDTEAGRRRVLILEEADNMIAALEAMMSGGDAGGSRNACFALTCLVTSPAGHQHVLKSRHFPGVLDTLCHLLQSEEPDSCWFSAITVKGISKFPPGVLRLRRHPTLETILKRIAASRSAGDELLQEVELTLRHLQRLPQPAPPTAKILESGSAMVAWKEYRPHSGLTVTYSLYDGDHLLYRGPSFSYVLPHCKPGHHHLKVVMDTEGDRSPASGSTLVTVEEPLPGCPIDFQAVGRTATRVKLSWSPPAGSGIKYAVYKEDVLVETTPDLSCILGGLSPSTTYTFSVRSCNSRGRSPRVSVVARTMDTGDRAPDRLTLYVVGRSEIFITWEGPKDPVGRFFNYDLSMNGKSVYLGTERSYTARRLTPSTDYTCTVCAITSEGRFESRPVTKRTARDEYSNLNKNPTGGNRHPDASPTAEVTDQTEKTPRTEPARRSSLTKSQSLRLLMTRTGKSRRDNKASSTRPRRDSDISWTSDPNDRPQTSQSSPTKVQPSTPSDVPPGQMSRNLQKEGRPEKKPEPALGRSPAVASPKIPPRSLDNPPTESCLPPDAKDPPSTLGFRPTPIAAVYSLQPEALLNGRTRTETEQMGPTPQDGPVPPILLQEASRLSDKDRFSTLKKALQPVRDPVIRYRHRSLSINAWDFTQALLSGEKKMCKLSATCPLSPTEESPANLPSVSKGRRDSLLARAAGRPDRRRHSWSHLRSDLSTLQDLRGAHTQSVESLQGQRRKGSLSCALPKEVHVLIGDAGVTFRLPPAPISLPLRVRPHH